MELQVAQAPLKPGIRQTEMKDWENMRKYRGNILADMVCNTFKHITRIGTLPPSSHLRRQFKSPNPALNTHRRDEVDATDQICTKIPAMDSFVCQDSKITDVYKAKANSGAEFL